MNGTRAIDIPCAQHNCGPGVHCEETTKVCRARVQAAATVSRDANRLLRDASKAKVRDAE